RRRRERPQVPKRNQGPTQESVEELDRGGRRGRPQPLGEALRARVSRRAGVRVPHRAAIYPRGLDTRFVRLSGTDLPHARRRGRGLRQGHEAVQSELANCTLINGGFSTTRPPILRLPSKPERG